MYVEKTPAQANEYNEKPYMSFYLATDDLTGEKVFMKEFDLNYNETIEEMFKREVEFYQKFDNPFILKPIGYNITNNRGCLILPYLENGDLFDAIAEKQAIITPEAHIKFAYNLLQAVQDIHSKNVTHNDLKLENILIEKFDYYYGDIYLNPDYFVIIDGGSLFTDENSPPEKRRSQAYDIWTVGIILYKMVAKDNPFDASYNPKPTYFDEEIWENYNKIQPLIENFLSFNPNNRMTASQALDEGIFKRYRN